MSVSNISNTSIHLGASTKTSRRQNKNLTADRLELSRLRDRACPLGTTGQRRPSRSPRSQRSRSADVDCLKKYTERRVEERRHTDVADTSKLDPSRWIPLTKNMSRSQPTTSKKSPQSSRDDDKRRSVSVDIEETINNIIRSGVVTVPKKLTPTKEEETTKEFEEKDEATTTSTTTMTTTTTCTTTVLSSTLPTTHRTGGRSLSTDVGRAKNEKLVEERRHTEADPRMIATRWLPQINISRFRYDASSFTRISNTDITKLAAARWLTFVKNPSPSPIPRMNPERKPSTTTTTTTTTTTMEQAGVHAEEKLQKETKNVSPKWEPIRKFSSVAQAKSDRDAAKEKDEAESNRASPSSELSPDSAERSKRLTQRMKDLYDFKTENEWPKRVVNVCRENMWISKSSSEEERPSQPVRRNSQDLEFNDRVNVIKLRDTKVQSDFQTPKDPAPKKEDPPKSSEIFDSEYEERIRKFNDRLRFSEDLGVAKPKLKERRTYSDDSEEKVRRSKSARSARSESVQESSQPSEGKRNSDASSRSRGSYAEVSPVKRDSRTSTASYASVGSTKRASIDDKSTTQMVEVPPRRAFSQTEKRPATPVPPVEFNDDRYVAGRLKVAERQKRNSTRYKVYLT
ncbi:uncharacterized protein LOC143213655 [Lasioglossum baleicum]|uniref:uncharacterized protein LOC143213655 n=1 Tax=Lasioglossum baleicum TaxID=434251 RepID=UPI003FCCFA11